MTFTVTRTNVVGNAFTVDYATANGTATAGSDYTATTGTLSFAADQVSATVTVAITPDATPEFDETLFLNLTNASGATIADAQGQGTIVNDDGAPITISIGDVSVQEGQSGTSLATFTITRSGGTGAFSVDYATANGTATAGSDYVAASGTVNFAVGELTQTVTVTINGDVQSEPTENFTVNLTNADQRRAVHRFERDRHDRQRRRDPHQPDSGQQLFQPVRRGAGHHDLQHRDRRDRHGHRDRHRARRRGPSPGLLHYRGNRRLGCRQSDVGGHFRDDPQRRGRR